MKGNLRGVVIPLNKVIPFFRESLMRRKLNVDRKHSITPIKTLLESAGTAGFQGFSRHLTASLTNEGIKLTLEQFNRGFGYKVKRLNNTMDIEECLTTEVKRGPSALRFRCLVTTLTGSSEDACKFIEGDYYKVTSRSINGSIDIVLITRNGNIACTSPSYARWGIPSKHILSVFIDGNLRLNMKQHFHPVFHLQFMNDIGENSFTDHSIMSDISHPEVRNTDLSTCWNWAQKSSSASWENVGLGGESLKSIARPSARSISQAPESVAEKTKKAFNFIMPYINNNQEEREIFFLYYEGLLKRLESICTFIIIDYLHPNPIPLVDARGTLKKRKWSPMLIDEA